MDAERRKEIERTSITENFEDIEFADDWLVVSKIDMDNFDSNLLHCVDRTISLAEAATASAIFKEVEDEVDRKIAQCTRSFNSGTDKECRHGVMALTEFKNWLDDIKAKFGVE